MEKMDATSDILSMDTDDAVGLSDIIEILSTLDNQSPELNNTLIQLEAAASFATPTIAPTTTAAVSPPSSTSPSSSQGRPTVQQIPSSAPTSLSRSSQKPFINIVEQPAGKALRFRYECEGRSAGSIPGVNSTPENKTYPTIEIVGYKGEVIVVVSCVTKDAPYRPHPHKLVGKDGCKNGVCRIDLNGEPLRAVFSNLGIQCVKKKDLRAELEHRERLKVDPFRTGFDHKDQPSGIDLNAVRLAFQAFLKTSNGGYKPLKAVVSDPIYDKKAMSDLVICRLCSCAANVNGGTEIILLCEKIMRDDIKVRFFETNADDQIIWEDYAQFQQSDIHKLTAITFKTPRYHKTDITESAKVYIQLLRPSDRATSEPLPFEFFPDQGTRIFPRIQRKLRRKRDLEIFQQILSLDSETTVTKCSGPSQDLNADEDDAVTVSSDSASSNANSSSTLNDIEEANIHQTDSETDINEAAIGKIANIELEVPQIALDLANEIDQKQIQTRCRTQNKSQVSISLEKEGDKPDFEAPRDLSMVDKISEWMRSSEFERTESLIVENGDSASLSPVTVYKNFSPMNYSDSDPMELGAELYDLSSCQQSRRGTLENPMLKELPSELSDIIEMSLDIPSNQASLDIDENFDETATYTSLQIAFNNPIEIPLKDVKCVPKFENPRSLPMSDVEGVNVLTNPPAPKIQVNVAQTPSSPPSPTPISSPPLPLPPRTPSPGPDQVLPPLPPKHQIKRKRLRDNGSTLSRLKMELQQPKGQFNNEFTNISTPWIASFLPEIKTEPAMSPQQFNTYRSPYHMSPSPQPPSPMTRNDTPSPALMKPFGGMNPTPNTNQLPMMDVFSFGATSPIAAANTYVTNTKETQQFGGNSFMANEQICDNNLSVPAPSKLNLAFDLTNNNNSTNRDANINKNATSNPFVDHFAIAPTTSGGSFTPLNDNAKQFVNMSMNMNMNIIDSLCPPSSSSTTLREQQMVHMQNDIGTLVNETNEEGPTLSGLLALVDSEQLLNVNSDELALSNLSITT